jgi:hypothetical protein
VPPALGCPRTGPSSPEVTRAICRVPSTSFSQAPGYALPVHLCRFRVRSIRRGCFPEVPGRPSNPIRRNGFRPSSRIARLGIVRPIPIGYGCRPRLRGRLTLRGLTLRRNPWTFGERVSHPLCRYSCQHSRLPYLQHASRHAFDGLGNAPLPRDGSGGPVTPAASVHGLSPVTFSAQGGLTSELLRFL